MNRLGSATSPYLLQHAGNPVDWYEWGTEALAAAADQDKPILLSVGYAACHWCDFMDRTLRIWRELVKMQVRGAILVQIGSLRFGV